MEQRHIDKREEVLNALEHKARAFGVKIDYVFDEENHREYLVCDSINICTNHTSVYGVVQEFIGYLFLYRYDRHISKRTQNDIKSYWYDKNFKQPWNK